MKVPLGWLAEWVDLPDAGGALRSGSRSRGSRSRRSCARARISRRSASATCSSAASTRTRTGCRSAGSTSARREPRSRSCAARRTWPTGQKVAVALPGTTLPDGTKLKKSKIRGEASEGMICSARELGLCDEHAGILVLDPAAKIGAALPEVMRAGETILDVEITPNRGDWVSMLGMAREVRALFGGTLRMPPCEPVEGARAARRRTSRIAIEDARRLPALRRPRRARRAGRAVARLAARAARGRRACARSTTSSTSRTWCCSSSASRCTRSTSARLRGGADPRAPRGGRREARHARRRDARARRDDLVIADAERAIALAGVMGGAETEVRAATRDIADRERAVRARARAAQRRRRLGLRTEASYRFERGVDRDGVARAADRCARLLAELSGGTVSSGRVEALGTPLRARRRDRARPRAPQPPARREPRARGDRRRLLVRVGVRAQPDVERPAALRDPELAQRPRDPGGPDARRSRASTATTRLEPTMPFAAIAPVTQPRRLALLERAREVLARRGAGRAAALPVARPRGPRRAAAAARRPAARDRAPGERRCRGRARSCRAPSCPALLHAAQRNLARQVERLRVFEVGRVFHRARAARAAGRAAARGGPGHGRRPRRPVGRRGAAVAVLHGQGPGRGGAGRARPAERVRPAGSAAPWLHPGAAASCAAATRSCVGWASSIPRWPAPSSSRRPARSSSSTSRPASALAPESPRYREPSPYPAVRRDLAVLLDRGPARRRGPRGDPPDGRVSAGQRGRSSTDTRARECPRARSASLSGWCFSVGDRTLQDTEVGKTIER